MINNNNNNEPKVEVGFVKQEFPDKTYEQLLAERNQRRQERAEALQAQWEQPKETD